MGPRFRGDDTLVIRAGMVPTTFAGMTPGDACKEWGPSDTSIPGLTRIFPFPHKPLH